MTTAPSPRSFIRSELDEYGLPPAQLKVYCHILRRNGGGGVYFESSRNCALFCNLNVKTVRKAIRKLAECGLIAIADTPPGLTRCYLVTDIKDWKQSPYRIQDPTQKMGRVSKWVNTQPKKRVAHPTQSNTPKGNPLEVNPNKGETLPISVVAAPAGKTTKLYPHEYDDLIADARNQIKKLRENPRPGSEEAIIKLRVKINEWKSQKLGVDLPPPTSTPISTTPKSIPKSGGKSVADIPRHEWLALTEAMRKAVDKLPGK